VPHHLSSFAQDVHINKFRERFSVIHEEITVFRDTYKIGIFLCNECGIHLNDNISKPRRPQCEYSLP
jgi:rubrerythrin